MKKFLFTLAAAVIALSSSALENKLWIDDVELTTDQLGTEVMFTIGMENTAVFNGYQFDIIWPEGITPTDYESGADTKFTYISTKRGATEQGSFSVKANEAITRFVGICPVATEYDEEGNEYGAVKFPVGTHPDFIRIYTQVDADFAGGDIILYGIIFSSGKDTRENLGSACNVENDTCHVTVPATTKDLTGDIKVVDNGDGTATVSYTGPEDVKIVVNGEEVENGKTYDLVNGENKFDVVVSAEGYNDKSDSVVIVYDDPAESEVILVLCDKDGKEVKQIPLPEGESELSWVTVTDILYKLYGPEGTNAKFYFLIDGVPYYANQTADTMADLGDAMQNPLTDESDKYYMVATGFNYSIGVKYNDGVWYAYVAIGAATGVNELAAGKTVASTRYFNMAGQEMTEANGMTIVVTTYTDGTTNATKVMK